MLITRLLTSLALIFLFSGFAVAQTGLSDRCQVFVAHVTGKKSADVGFSSARDLGTFDTVVGEEKLTSRTYRLPNTKLYVIASVWFTDESLASTKGADSISLRLMISTQPTSDMLRSLIYADAEMPLNGFDVGRVTTLVKTGNRTRVVIMECRPVA